LLRLRNKSLTNQSLYDGIQDERQHIRVVQLQASTINYAIATLWDI